MSEQKYRVLIVDDDPDVRELLGDQIFNPTRYEVFYATDGIEGVAKVEKHQPDLIYLDLVMPGLSGKDMLVGIKSRKYEGAIIVGVKRGNEPEAIEAFRFGATDYITKPIREAEMMSVVSRAMSDVRLRRERQELMRRLQNNKEQLEVQLKQISALVTLGKRLTSIHSLDEMFEAVLGGAIEMTGADHATVLLYDGERERLVLRAGKNMTLVMQDKLGDTVRDELASLVMTSHEAAIVSDDALRRFKISRDIYAAIYAPLVMSERPIGVLTVGNHRKRQAFDEKLGNLVKALADYTAIAIMNARLFAALEQRAQATEKSYRELAARDQKIAGQLHAPLGNIEQQLAQIAGQNLPPEIRQQLKKLGGQTREIREFVRQMRPLEQREQRPSS
jgi:DNA-binding response OmpR family regulator